MSTDISQFHSEIAYNIITLCNYSSNYEATSSDLPVDCMNWWMIINIDGLSKCGPNFYAKQTNYKTFLNDTHGFLGFFIKFHPWFPASWGKACAESVTMIWRPLTIQIYIILGHPTSLINFAFHPSFHYIPPLSIRGGERGVITYTKITHEISSQEMSM